MATPKPDDLSRNQSTSQKKSHPRGSGSDLNSDTHRLRDESNLQDKIIEDSFPASDPPSNTPLSGVGRTDREVRTNGPKSEFKENAADHFEYGRRVGSEKPKS